MAQNINTCVITGNLTRDPELRGGGDTTVCGLRVAVNGRRKDNATGEWIDDPNYFDVTVFGRSADNCAKYLAKGRPVAISGRLDWSEWETPEGQKRQAVKIVASSVQFLGGRDDAAPQSEYVEPAPVAAQVAAPAPPLNDDIPF